MIEIRIPTSAAVLLLKEKIIIEFKALQKANVFPEELLVENLSNSELLSITETAAQDLVFTLPAEIFSTESNIVNIIYKAIKTFASQQKSKAFDNYTLSQAEAIVSPIKNLFKIYGEKEVFSKN